MTTSLAHLGNRRRLTYRGQECRSRKVDWAAQERADELEELARVLAETFDELAELGGKGNGRPVSSSKTRPGPVFRH